MINYKFGDIILIDYPFSEQTQNKKRPALVILDSNDDDIVVSRITTRLYDSIYDVQLINWEISGLLKESVVRLHKIATIGKNYIQKKLGSISKNDAENIKLHFKTIYQLSL